MERLLQWELACTGGRTRLRVALITGAGGGLALAIARGLAADGFALALNVRRDPARAEALAAEVRSGDTPVAVDLFPGDMAVEDEARGLVRSVLERYGRLDVLVHTVGPFNFAFRDLANYQPSAWRRYLDGNLSSLFWVVQEALPAMRAQRWGRIIAFGFDGAERATGWPGHAAYAAAKAGVVSLVRSLAMEEARHGITVHAVCPADIPDGAKEWEPDDPRVAEIAPAPVGRTGTGGDVAHLIRFLCRPESEFITGTATPVSGAEPAWAISAVTWMRRQGLVPFPYLYGEKPLE